MNKVSGTSFLYSEKNDFRETGLTVFILVLLNNLGKKIESSKYFQYIVVIIINHKWFYDILLKAKMSLVYHVKADGNGDW